MPYLKKPEKTKQTSVKRNERNEVYTSTRWRKLRLAYLQNHPLCEMCLQVGKYTPSIDVHHKVSFMSTNDPLKRKWLAFDYDNLMSLCKECHQKVHNNKACQN